MKSFRNRTVIAAFTLFAATAALAGNKPAPVNQSPGGIAIKGYDPVAYFTDSKPVKGKPQFEYTWRGAKWQFASAEHRDLFAKGPEKYAPQYGGYCAYGVGEGHTVSIDPDAWKIVDGKLYLNYSSSVQQQFLKDVPGRIRKADENWPNLHQ
jgi:YHS domain-containing protein